jgi:hypothetical protein
MLMTAVFDLVPLNISEGEAQTISSQLRANLALKTLSARSLGFLEGASVLCSRASGPKGLSAPWPFVRL